MSAIIIPLPGVPAHLIRPRATSIDDLPMGTRALVAFRDESGSFAVVPRPAVTDKERNTRRTFDTARQALNFARRMYASHPRWYGLVIDETGRRRGSLDDVMGYSSDPMGLGGAA